MSAYYNEHDPYAAKWLRNLIAAGHIAPGDVDTRSIREVTADDLRPYTQCHFFAGIGVWSHALRRAGWRDDWPVWTGSCPCQPFSAAGQQKGFDDDRHLWPVWHRLIRERRPPVVLGEQVASALQWLDLVSTDMEASGYAFAAADLCAAGFGGAHIRQRLYFAGVDDRQQPRLEGHAGDGNGGGGWPGTAGPAAEASCAGGLADTAPELDDWSRNAGPGRRSEHSDSSAVSGLADTKLNQCEQVRENAGGSRGGSGTQGLDERSADRSNERRPHAPMLGRHPADWLFCRDGKWRPVEPGTFPLADAPAARVGRLRAYGNALDAETATQFVGAVMESLT